MSSPRKEDIAGSPIYRLIARNSLRELHSNLMKSLYGFFVGRPGKHTLVVAGQGPEVVPFSRNLDLVEEMVGDGNIAMFDYNPDIIATSVDALVKPRFDSDEVVPENKKKGITERGYELMEVDSDEVIDLRKIGDKKIIVRQGDLSSSFKFADSSVSAFEATLAIHHVTAYRQGLEHVINEVCRILEPDGLFHWGTGNVNMRYQEEKIHRVANALKRFYNSDVTLEDCRDSSTGSRNIVARAFYSKSLEYLNVPLLDEKSYQHSISGSNNPIRMRITKEGGIYIKLSERRESDEFKQYLLSHGFKQVHSIGKNELLLPIIDQGMQEDRDQFLESVRGYYRGIIDLNTGVFAGRPDIAAKVFAADNKEFGDASCGLFEYYTDPKIVMGMLQARGFVNIGYQSDSKGIWCNITAQKS